MSDSTVKKKRRFWRPTRRQFLIGVGATGVVAAGGLYFGIPVARREIAGLLDGGSAPGGVSADPPLWFEILPDNTINIHLTKAEMGQGIHTSLKQIAAQELGAAWAQLKVVQASTVRGPNDSFGTGGSSSVPTMYPTLREAGASMREMLRIKAAEKLGVATADVSIEDGIATANGSSLTYGEIVAGVTEWAELDEIPPLKPKSEFKYIGKSIERVDFEDKLTGRAVYGLDARMDGMLYGAVVRPRQIGATLVSADTSVASAMDGVVDIVEDGDFVGVIAESRYAAQKARDAIKTEWNVEKVWQQAELEAMVSVGEGKETVIQREGNGARDLSSGRLISASYRTPMAAHAHLEPQAALVEVTPTKVTVQASTQNQSMNRGDVAEALGVDEEIIDVVPLYLGGGFGRKLNNGAAVDAARLSAHVGRPVHVGWTRAEEFHNGYVRPMTHSTLTAKLGSDGLIESISHEQASGDVAFPFFPAIAASVLGADFGAWRGSIIQYDVPNRETVAWRTEMPLATGWWRGLGLMANTFAVESFIDEVALEADMDPLEFRLAQLGATPRTKQMRDVLQAAADKANWGAPLPEGRAQGIALSIDVGTPCAHVAEVSLENGRIRVHKVTAAIDPGMIVNPDGSLAQTQGSIIMGMSSVFNEELIVKDGAFTADNFNNYPLITMKEAPEIEVVLMESGGDPKGMGEPPIGPIAAAIANAYFALTGERLRTLPLRPTPPTEASSAAGDPTRGEDVYNQCIACHGDQGSQIPGLDYGLTDSEWVASSTDQHLFDVIRNGRAGSDPNNISGISMPGFNQLTDQEIYDVVAYLRSLP